MVAEPAATWPEEKRCAHCKHVKAANCFYRNKASKTGLSSWCKMCTSARDKQPVAKARRAAYKHSPHGRAVERRGYLKRKFGLTLEDYDRMLAAQGGVCAICAHSAKGRNLAVDHDHSCCPGDASCGKCVRGLLCRQCNHKILGYWLHEGIKGTEQALATARRLVAYLERSQDGRVAGAA